MGNKTKSLLSSYHGKKRRLTSIVSEKMSYEKELLENRINDGIVEYTPIITPIHNKNMPFYYFYKFVLVKLKTLLFLIRMIKKNLMPISDIYLNTST